MTTQSSKPTLDEVRARVRGDHTRLRAMLDELARLARTVDAEGGKGGSSRYLTDAIWDLFLLFDDHLAMEERDLVPLLERAGVWGKVPVDRMHEEHRQQRAVFLAMVEECDGETKHPLAIADDANWLVESLRRDMDREEREFESIRDDGYVVDQFTG